MINKRMMAGFAAVAALSMGLAGCGSDTSNNTNTNAGGDTGSTDEVVNITYMHRLPDNDGMVLVNDIVAKWNK